ncbi:MAG: response regulator [Candidatus Delongbacteria bacterium]|nr:response regulator [Candidatus Delongbacteria bacterium]MBN2833751.1 response regulator [Candidatus Delongbacteria bacterium]
MCKILTIDDEAYIRNSFKNYLDDEGFIAIESDSAVLGLEIAKNESPDLILLDLRMPLMDGFKFIEEFSTLGLDIPIIVISGTGNINDVLRAVKLGASDFILKPIEDMGLLKHSIESVLEKSRLKRENKNYQLNLELEVKERTEELLTKNMMLENLVNDLKISEEKNRALSEATLEAVIFTENNEIIEVNKRFFELFNYKNKSIYGKNILEFICEEHQQLVKDSILSDSSSLYEVNAQTDNGIIIPVEIQTRPYNLLNKKLKVTVIRDISEKKENEYEKEKLNIYFSNILNAMPSIVAGCDNKGKIIFWNQTAEKMIGISNEEALNKPAWDVLSHFDIADRLLNVFSSGKEFIINRAKADSGTIKYYNLRIFPIQVSTSAQAVIKIDDITDSEIMEAQLRQAQKMESIGNLAGGLAHDFNNVLGGISGTASLIKYKYKPKDDFKEYMDLIETSVNRAADMVKQLLTLSRRQELLFAPVDLNLAIKHVLNICRNSFDKSIEFEFSQCHSSPMVYADPTQIEQVFLNIAINASHAMTIMREQDEEQGGILTFDIEKKTSDNHFIKIFPEALMNETYWKISISDTGIGMSREIIDKIYDPFFTTKPKEKGTGLGLAMVYNLVKLHNGFISVYSEVNKGTIFSIYLPKLLDSSSGESFENVEDQMFSGEGKILLVDDETILRKVASDMLEQFGFEVVQAENGIEAVEIFKKNPDDFSMVILDINMPKQSGSETFKILKNMNPDLKIIITSGYKSNQTIDNLLNAGAVGFIQKPYTMENLSKIINKSII